MVRLTGFNEHIAVRNCVVNGSTASSYEHETVRFSIRRASAARLLSTISPSKTTRLTTAAGYRIHVYGGFSTATFTIRISTTTAMPGESAYYFGVYLTYTPIQRGMKEIHLTMSQIRAPSTDFTPLRAHRLTLSETMLLLTPHLAARMEYTFSRMEPQPLEAFVPTI